MTKIRREMLRVVDRLRDRLSIIPERRAQARRDRLRGADMRVTQGVQPGAARVALYVLWQPAGLARSAFGTCRHLLASGYATVVISNAALSDADRAELQTLCWLMIERPNLGHDFGAWRDALLHLSRSGTLPSERLVLLNDSIWFPLLPGDRLLADLEQPGVGFTGPVWMERPGRAHAAHFQSYLLMFGPAALRHPAFMTFWQGYLASSRRESVLRRGEKGLTRAMHAAGLAGPPTLSPATLLAHAAAADDAELARVLDFAAIVDPAQVRRRDAILADRHARSFRSDALDLLRATLASGHFVEAHPYLAAQAGRGPHFLKKRREARSVEGRRQFLRAIADGLLPAPDPALMAEIRARDLPVHPAEPAPT
jgi:Rhamnan synthesis protein F